jgi:hypothetical protein
MLEYKVQFIGLAYFQREENGRRVLLPDGRDVEGVTPHAATIAVAANDLIGDAPFTGWAEGNIQRTPTTRPKLIQFELSNDSIEIEGASGEDAVDPLDTRSHDGELQPLTATAGSRAVKIAPEEARIVADVLIRRGELGAFRFPGSNDDGNAAIISQLRVPFDGDTVTITVTPRGNGNGSSAENGVRTITVRNGSEIAIVNASRPLDSRDDEGDLEEDDGEDETEHFSIYEQLAPGLLKVGTPRATRRGFPRSKSEHLLFRLPNMIGSSVKCSNTCC